MWWKEPITTIKGIGPKRAADLTLLGISTVGDLLAFYPRQESYLDYSKLKTIKELTIDGAKQVFKGEVCAVRNGFGSHRKAYTVVTVRDETGYANLYFFQSQRFGVCKLANGTELLIIGRVKSGRNAKSVSEVQIQKLTERETKAPGIMPVYPLAGNLTQNNLRKWMRDALSMAKDNLPETLPKDIIKDLALEDRLTALKNIHFPPTWEALHAAQHRFIFEELFMLQCGLLCYRQKHTEEKIGIKHGADGKLLQRLLARLPFKLTDSQIKVWREISLDMQGKHPMHRLLQGDVGSGKTVIAALCLAKAVENGYQGCLMAPTEILAVQHYNTLKEYFEPLGVRIALLTGGLNSKARRELLMNLELGLVGILVGTHALIEEDVRFAHLSVAITDEQHRFGVEQRAKLANKSKLVPDVLIMTATPIPRTLALTVYGDLDISIMQGRPSGRKVVQTLCYTEDRRQEVYAGLVRQVQAGRQAYVVCPLIEESEFSNVHNAEMVYEELRQKYLGNIPCALLHGRLKNSEKETIMADFVAGRLKVLVSTTVIEVGVNVPNANLIIIENAERFGLAQLHQLRGRVGRGSIQSYCVLLTPSDNPETLARLGVLHNSNDGFYLAEKDLQLRGAGQLFGVRQHGLPDLRIADIMRDADTIALARRLAEQYLSRKENRQEIYNLVEHQFGDRFAMIFKA